MSKRLKQSGEVFLLLVLLIWLFCPRPPLLEGVNFSTCVYDREHHLLRLTLTPDGAFRVYTPLEKIAPVLRETTVLYEDRYFFQHPGANPAALLRGLAHEFSGGRRIGASTIPMQVARLRFRLHTRTWWGKSLQILRALQLERHYTKAEILEAYLNLCSYGRNVQGAGAASLLYYGESPDYLTLSQALTLSVVPQSPARRAPRLVAESGGDNRALFSARAALFRQWVNFHPEDADKTSVLEMALQVRSPASRPFLAPHLVDYIVTQAAGSSITTTVDLSLQRLLERQIERFVEARQDRGIHNAAALLVDYRTMEVLAGVGSADYFSVAIQGQVNGLNMRRSPGSTLKPFVYGLALDQGVIHPHSLLKDTPLNFAGYNPENFDRDFSGAIQAQQALIQSRNTPAVWLASRLKPQSFYQFLQKIGVADLQGESHYGLTLALGSAEVSMEDLARGYALLANHGVLQPLQYLRNHTPTAGRRLLSPEASFLVLDMLKECSRPDGAGRQSLTAPVAWKTGTSWSFRDAWSVAVFDHYVLVVWVGNFDGSGDAALVGRKCAAPLLFSMIDAIRASQGTPTSPPSWQNHQNLHLAEVDLCALTGDLATAHCLHRSQGWFIPGVSPLTTCSVHQLVAIDPHTHLRLPLESAPPEATKEIYEVWPSDLAELFRLAGLPRRSPPPYARDSALARESALSTAPRIISPRANLTYALRLSAEASARTVALSAVTAADTTTLYWFSGSALLGLTAPAQTLAWGPEPGRHQVRVVDNRGRSDQREINVELLP